MSKINLQVRIPQEIEFQIVGLSPTSKSAFVREAIEEKIRREKFRRLEEEWINALGEKPEDKCEARRWLKAEGWGPK